MEETHLSLVIQSTFTLDLYELVGDKETKRPLIVLAFGGAFVTGETAQLGEEAKYFVDLVMWLPVLIIVSGYLISRLS